MSKRTDLKIIVLVLMIWAGMVVIPPGAYASEVLRVGVISSLNGSQAPVGQEVRDGALLAIQQIHEGWKEKDARIAALERSVAELKALVQALAEKGGGSGR